MTNFNEDQRQSNYESKRFTMIPDSFSYAVMRLNLSPREHRYLWALLLKTYRYQKEMDWIADTQIAVMTGMARPHVNDAKQKLLNRRIIIRDGKRIGPNKNIGEWDVPKSVHVPVPVHPSTENGTNPVPELVRKNTGAGTHRTREMNDSLTKEPSEREMQFRNDLLQQLKRDDFAEPLADQWPIIQVFAALAEADGEEKFQKKWRGLQKLDHYKDIRNLKKFYSLYKSSPL
jgi:phage replication O-like protein O